MSKMWQLIESTEREPTDWQMKLLGLSRWAVIAVSCFGAQNLWANQHLRSHVTHTIIPVVYLVVSGMVMAWFINCEMFSED